MRKILFLFIAFLTLNFFGANAQTITPIDSIQQVSSANLANGIDLSYKNGDTVWIKGVCMFNPCNYAQSGSQGYPQRLSTYLVDTSGKAWRGVQVMLDPAVVGMTNNKDSVVSLDQAVGFINNFQFGTLVKCRGIVTDFDGNTQFSLIKTPSVAIGPSATPSPLIVAIDSFEKLNQSTALQDIQLPSGEKYEGTYVQINNPIITNVSTSTANRYRYDIKDAAGNEMVVQDNFSGVFTNTNYDMFCTGNNGVSNTPTPYTGYSNGTVVTYLRGFVQQYLNTSTNVKYYSIAPLQLSDIGAPTYAPPTITNIRINPGNPTPSQTVNVLADVTDDSSVAVVKCYYAFGLNSTTWQSVNMTLSSGITYSGTIPATTTDSVWVKYYIKAVDNFGHTSFSPDTLGTNNWYLSIQRPINKIADVQGRAYGNGKSIYCGDSLVGINIQGIVTATSQQDDLGLVTIQDGTNKYSGIALTGGASVSYLHRGEKVIITAAKVNEVSGAFLTSNIGMTTLANPTFTIVSTNNALPLPITTLNMDSIHLNNSNYTEPYEAMLIGFNNVVVADTNPDHVTNGNFGEWAVYSSVGSNGVRCDDYSNDIPSTFNTDSLTVGESLCFVNGIVQYAHGNWKMLPRNRADICGFHTVYTKLISSFNIGSTTGFVNQSANTISVGMPAGTIVTSLTPTILFTGMTVSPATNVAQDFTNPVAYTVTAADGTTRVYNVTVTVPNGISKVNLLDNVQLYPNPAQTAVNIVLPNNLTSNKTIVHVQSLTGVNLGNYEFSNNNIHLSTADLADGMYLLQIENGSDKKVMKLTIMK